MPLYEYCCNQCHYQCEKLEKINAQPRQCCPKCQTQTLDRIVSMTHFQLKGDGSYATDFKKPATCSNNDPSKSIQHSENSQNKMAKEKPA